MKRPRVPPAQEDVDVGVPLVLRSLHYSIELFNLGSDCRIAFGEITAEFD